MLLRIAACLALVVAASPLTARAEDVASFKSDYLSELDYAASRLVALAEAVPAEKYAWRPGAGVRSVSEVYAHVALGNFLLLDVVGHVAPEDLYGKVPAMGRERSMALVTRNGELEKSIAEKARVVELLKRSLETLRVAVEGTAPSELEKPVDFFGREKTVRAVYLRMLAHAHEHMGQSIAYARVNGIVPPWSQPASKE
jgi:uncharacterized damage-inducible protein DinB